MSHCATDIKHLNKRQRIPKGGKMDNPEKLATQCTRDEEKQNMCWTPLYENKHK